MSTARIAILEALPKGRIHGLPSRRTAPSERLVRIKEMAGALLAEAETLDHEHALSEASAMSESLELKSGVDFFDEVKRFEMRLIGRALELTGGNQSRAARLLGLGTTTLNYKVKAYKLA